MNEPRLLKNLSIIKSFAKHALQSIEADQRMIGIQCEDETLKDAMFKHVDVRQSRFTAMQFDHCDFEKASFVDCVFERCDLSNSTFKSAYFERLAPILNSSFPLPSVARYIMI